MTFRWQRTPSHVTSTCDACGAQITGRTDTQILRDQRAHDDAACIGRQRAARVADLQTRIDRAMFSLTEGGEV
jgi:hypothetical protein